MSYWDVQGSSQGNFGNWSDWSWERAHDSWVRRRMNDRGDVQFQLGARSSTNGLFTPQTEPQLEQAQPRYAPAATYPTIQRDGFFNQGYSTYSRPPDAYAYDQPRPQGTYPVNTTQRDTQYTHLNPQDTEASRGDMTQSMRDLNISAGGYSYLPRPGGYDSNRDGGFQEGYEAENKDQTAAKDKITADRTGSDKYFRTHNSKSFSVGQVFKVDWSEPKGAGGTEITADDGQSTYRTIRRFVVVKKFEGHSLCIPILTYGNQGTGKPGLKPEHHTIIYTSERPPPLLPKERKLHKKPIRVTRKTPREKLSDDSRLNYAKVYTIEHNVPVYFIGRVHDEYTHTLLLDFERTQSQATER